MQTKASDHECRAGAEKAGVSVNVRRTDQSQTAGSISAAAEGSQREDTCDEMAAGLRSSCGLRNFHSLLTQHTSGYLAAAAGNTATLEWLLIFYYYLLYEAPDIFGLGVEREREREEPQPVQKPSSHTQKREKTPRVALRALASFIHPSWP